MKCQSEAAAIFIQLFEFFKKEALEKVKDLPAITAHSDPNSILTDEEKVAKLDGAMPKELDALKQYFQLNSKKEGVSFEEYCLDLVEKAPLGTVWSWNFSKDGRHIKSKKSSKPPDTIRRPIIGLKEGLDISIPECEVP